MSLLGAIGALASEMPAGAAWQLAIASLLWGGWRADALSRAPACLVQVAPGGATWLEGERLEGATWRWRGPLACLSWRGPTGRLRTLAWWPDRLDDAGRRDLRMALAARPAGRNAAGMRG